MPTPVPGLRSPHERVGGLVFFGRMLDKIRLEQSGALPPGYNLGDSNPNFFDARCCRFLRVRYADLRNQVRLGLSDEAVLEWCYAQGRRPEPDEVQMFNDFLRKRGWDDEGTPLVRQRKRELGLEDRDDVLTSFDVQDADEGRPLRRYAPPAS